MALQAGLDDLLDEAKLWILRCIAGGAESLPVDALCAMGNTNRQWHRLANSPEIRPFMAGLHSQLLTPQGPCIRNGAAWPPTAPLIPHRHKSSEPFGEADSLNAFLRLCIRMQFPPLMETLPTRLTRENWVQEVQNFRAEHFGRERGFFADGQQPEGDSPPPVWCAAACVLPGDRVCVAGGGCYNYELTNRQSDVVELLWHQPDVYVFDIGTRLWTKKQVSGTPPPIAHTYAAAHALLGTRWVFWCGGYYGQAYNSAYALDTEAWEWREMRYSSLEKPRPRYFLASFRFQGALYAWGGRSTENTYWKDLWRLDASRVRENVVAAAEMTATGDLPDAKFAATLTNCDDRFAVLYGGGEWVRGGKFRPDVSTYTLDLGTFAWTRLQVHGPQPTPRLQHAAVNLGGNLVLILGGYDGTRRRYLGLDDIAVLNVRSLQWMRLRRPRSRTAATAEAEEPRGVRGARGDDDSSDVSEVDAEHEEDDNLEEEDAATGEDQEEQDDADLHVPPLLSPSWEDAAAKTDWISGQFPTPRGGLAVAETEGHSFYIFGGAQYVHQLWYADLYKCAFLQPGGASSLKDDDVPVQPL